MKKKLLLIGLGAMMCLGMQNANAQDSITSVYPEPSASAYDYNTYMEITVAASSGITSFDEAVFSYNNENIVLEKNTYAGLNGAPDNLFIQLKVSYPGMTNYVKQAVDANADSFTITIKGVMCGETPVTASSLNNDRVTVKDGTVTLTYPLEKAPAYIPEESVWPEKIYSYWAPGAVGSTATLMFTQPVVSIYESTLVMGNVQDGNGPSSDDQKSYTIPTKFEGNKLILDFSGQHFDGKPSVVTVILRSVDGANGMPADFGDGSVSLFEHLSFSAEEAPGSGGTGVETILQENLEGKTIYNVKGEKVNSQNLKPGIYVIDGKKVLMK